MIPARATIQMVQRISDFFAAVSVDTYRVRADRNSPVKSPMRP
jgi:hypothetical protein